MNSYICEKKSPQIETENRKEYKLDMSIFRKKSKANTVAGLILQHAKTHRENKNISMAIYMQELFRDAEAIEKANKIKNKNNEIIKVEIIDGWKGKDQIDIRKDFENDFIVEDHIKDKETGEIKRTQHKILLRDVNRLKNLIKELNVGDTITYRELVKRIMELNYLKNY